MDHATETHLAAGPAGGFLAWRQRHALPPGSLCRNCATALRGPWCHHCGQLGEDFHRKAHHLIFEALESFFHADGRLAHTVPRLLLRPAALTRDYLAGKRAPQVPPLRLFLVVLLVVFVTGELTDATRSGTGKGAMQVDAKDRAEIMKTQVHVYKPWDNTLTGWVRDHVGRAVDHPEALKSAMGAWAHDFAFLTLPLSGLLLSLIFLFRRGFVLFDHLVFSMHSLAFQGLLASCVLALNATGLRAGVLALASPVHLFFHMRGVYGTSTLGTLARMALLAGLSMVCLSLLMAALVLVGLASLKS